MFGSLRKRVLTPALAEVTFAKRGFPAVPSEATRRLEAIPQAVICGFEWGIEMGDLWGVERRLSMVDPELRGFAYEGVTMAYTIRDAMAGGRGNRTRNLLNGSGYPHIFLAYIGIGFAMARLPRPLWRKVVPVLGESPYYPTMTWLAVDGYGFDRAYFDTRRWVDRQQLPTPYPWDGAPDYFPRAVDQGIGRALWFIHGARAVDVAAAVDRFPRSRRADLWSGVGLASAFAGGGTYDDLAWLAAAAGDYRPHLAQGTVFAVKARVHAGFVPAHTGSAATALTGLSVDEAVAVADSTAVTPQQGGDEPAYEKWRQRIAARFR
ncbi:DUF1702 family protein [Salinactinospora qingdaonensis]|uniref:DUF1702 family protein n=1 Tax=Salinactinospora qingdaonensis TaxID=702744 RepID=A0ABP7FVJ9_9ACTN